MIASGQVTHTVSAHGGVTGKKAAGVAAMHSDTQKECDNVE